MGRYFFFCSSVPKYTMGRVPMPVWPMRLTAKLPSRADFSETRQPDTLSRLSPPYSSGTSTARRPSSPALRSSSRVASYLRERISPSRGTISFSMNSSAVCAIIRCSSVKSSGVKTSSKVRSSTRKLPPLAATTGTLVSVAMTNLPFHIRSKIPAAPMPPPTHMVTRP